MSGDLSFQSRCGAFKGVVQDISPEQGTRVVCYCNDCQAFIHCLGLKGDYLDQKGVFQIDPGHLQITDGAGEFKSLSVLLMIVKVLGRTIAARLSGAYRENPFFNLATGALIAGLHLISDEERQTLYAGARGKA